MARCVVCGAHATESDISDRKTVVECPNGHRIVFAGFNGGAPRHRHPSPPPATTPTTSPEE